MVPATGRPGTAGAGKSRGGGDTAFGVIPPKKVTVPRRFGGVRLRWACGFVPESCLEGCRSAAGFLGEKAKRRLSVGCFPAGFQAVREGERPDPATVRKSSGNAERSAGESETAATG